MQTIEQQLLERKARLEASQRLALLTGGTGLDAAAADVSIRPRVPTVRLERGDALFRGRRCRIHFDGAESGATLGTRVRPAPSIGAGIHVEVARGANGEPVPVAVADPSTATIHLLVELSKATLEEDCGPDPLGAVAERVFAGPLAAIAGGDADVVIGSQVEPRVRHLANRGGGMRLRIEREIAFLRRARDAGDVHGALDSRMERLERYLAKAPETPQLSSAEREVSRLVHLVASRAVGFLRFDEEEIVGLLNPVGFDEARRRIPLGFGLRLRDPRHGTSLRFWSPETPADELRIACLGCGAEMFPQLADERDVFGVVDAVVNFAETNTIGVVPYTDQATLGGIWSTF
jgi:hypothetical protein